MDSQTRLGLELGAAALLLGVLGDQLLRVGPWGLNAFIWLGCFVVTSYGLTYRWQANLLRAERWFILPVCAVALLYLGRDAALLKLVTTGALGAALALGIQRAQIARLHVHDSLAADPPGLLAVGVNALTRMPRFLAREVDWKSLRAEGRGAKAAAVGRGLLIAAPLLVLFGALLASADAVFEKLVAHAFDVDPAHLPGHLLLTTGFAWIAGGFLYGVLCKMGRAPEEVEEPEPTAKKPLFSVGAVEVGVILGLLNLLFAAFVLVQLSYLFGGYRTVLHTVDLTMAQYARRGFFELAAVASLALPLLLGVRRLLAVKAGRPLRLYNALAGIQVGLLLMILVSAAQRMWLYQQAFGLTVLRLYVSAALVWLAFVLGWFLLSVLRDRIEGFVPGAVAAGFVMVLGLHVLNPDALIVKTNVARAQAGAAVDTAYLTQLSADAVPALLDALPLLSLEDRDRVARSLLSRWHDPERPDWRTWSRARTTARRAVATRASTLHALDLKAEAQEKARRRGR